MRRLTVIAMLILVGGLAACQSAAPTSPGADPAPQTGEDARPAAGQLPTHTPTATPPPTQTPIATATAVPTATPLPTPYVDMAQVEAAMVSTRRLEIGVPLVYYQAAVDAGVQCVGDCTRAVLLSLPTDTERDLVYTGNFPKIDLAPLDPFVPVVPHMSDTYRPHLVAEAADALYKFIKYVKYTTGEQIYVAHTWRPFYSGDTLGAGASQHQTGLAADLYLIKTSGEGVRRIDELAGVVDMANRYGWIQTFNFEAPHFSYLDAGAPGLTMALIGRGIDPNRNVYHSVNAQIAVYQILTDIVPPEIADQLAAEGEN